MNEDQHQQERHAGRSISVGVDAGSMADLELAALDAAREFFGPDAQLEVVRDYKVHDMSARNDPATRFMSTIVVREV